MNVGIYINRSKNGSDAAAERVKQCLSAHSVSFFCGSDIAQFEGKKSDIMIVIGGDGTILKVTGFCIRHNIKIFGINLGNVGFLTEVEEEGIESAIEKILAGEFFIERRMLLETEYGGQTHAALNDIVLSRAMNCDNLRTQIATIGAYVDDIPLYRYKSDGVICSTPTGSTAYSLSCGGAVLEPHLDAIQIVAICPHSLHTKPVVLPGSSVVRLCSDEELMLTADGRVLGSAKGEIVIKRHSVNAEFIKLKKPAFYERLVKKLSNWSSF